jgi:molybdenum cofactor guanylyltransferase
MIIKQPINACILAGGQSKRMGKDKGLVELDGKPMIVHVINAIQSLVGQINISTNNNYEYSRFGYPILEDVFPLAGPISGLYSCLYHSKNDYVLIVACDMPYINEGLIEYLISESDDSSDIIVPSHLGFIEPLCAIYNKRILSLVKQRILSHNRRMLDLLSQCKTKIINIESTHEYYHKYLFKNINSSSDLKKI